MLPALPTPLQPAARRPRATRMVSWLRTLGRRNVLARRLAQQLRAGHERPHTAAVRIDTATFER